MYLFNALASVLFLKKQTCVEFWNDGWALDCFFKTLKLWTQKNVCSNRWEVHTDAMVYSSSLLIFVEKYVSKSSKTRMVAFLIINDDKFSGIFFANLTSISSTPSKCSFKLLIVASSSRKKYNICLLKINYGHYKLPFKAILSKPIHQWKFITTFLISFLKWKWCSFSNPLMKLDFPNIWSPK